MHLSWQTNCELCHKEFEQSEWSQWNGHSGSICRSEEGSTWPLALHFHALSSDVHSSSADRPLFPTKFSAAVETRHERKWHGRWESLWSTPPAGRREGFSWHHALSSPSTAAVWTAFLLSGISDGCYTLEITVEELTWPQYLQTGLLDGYWMNRTERSWFWATGLVSSGLNFPDIGTLFPSFTSK